MGNCFENEGYQSMMIPEYGRVTFSDPVFFIVDQFKI